MSHLIVLGFNNEADAYEMRATLSPGTSALLVSVRKSTRDKVLEGLKPFIGKATVLRTSLTKEKADELREDLEGATSEERDVS